MKVKIKTWEDMEEEFGLKDEDVIACDFGWTLEKESELPNNRIIDLEYDIAGWLGWQIWAISDDMIEEYL